MDIAVIRHAIAHDRDPSLWPDDALRPLAEQGVLRFRRAAFGLTHTGLQIDRTFSSPWLRAWQTAELLSRETGWPAPEELPALAGDHSAEDVLPALSDVGADGTIAIVGHEPMLSELIAHMVNGNQRGETFLMRKGAAALVSFTGAAEPGAGQLQWLIQPRLLRKLGS